MMHETLLSSHLCPKQGDLQRMRSDHQSLDSRASAETKAAPVDDPEQHWESNFLRHELVTGIFDDASGKLFMQLV
jgi:hypothetical protein